MDVAVVSVISSGLVALGTIAVTFIGGERQRKHEADLDFEKRVWERKSEALFTVIERAHSLADSQDPVTKGNRSAYALDLSKMLDALFDNRAAVEAFASTECRAELTALIGELESQGVKPYLGTRASRNMSLAMKGGSADMDSFMRHMGWRKEAEEEALSEFEPNLTVLRERAERLLEAARQSVRRPKD